MHILQIYNKVPYPSKDGGSIAVLNISKGLKEHGHNVDILALNTSKHYVNRSEILKSKLNINIEFVDVNVKINPVWLVTNLLFSNLPYNAERFITYKFKEKLVQKINNNNYDLIQIEGLYMLPYIQTIRDNFNIPVSYRAHNIEHEIWDRSYEAEKNLFRKQYIRVLKRRIKRFEISLLNKYDYLVPITKKDENQFNHMGNIKGSFVCPAGINSNDYKYTKYKIKDFKLFFLGSLDWLPNTEGLLWFLENIWKPISKQYDQLRFSVAGRNASVSLIRKIKQFDNIDFYGEIDDAISYLQDHSVMIVPLRSGSGMRIKILEAMASSDVVITTSLGLEGIDAKNEEEVLTADSVTEFKKYIEQLIEGKISVTDIGINAKKFVSDKFDNFVITKKLIEFYKQHLNL